MTDTVKGLAGLAKSSSRILERDVDFEILETVAIFCALGFLASLVALSFGIDLSPGLF